MKRNYLILLLMLSIVSACNDSSSNKTQPPKNYSIATNVSQGGKITPAQLTVEAGKPAVFTINNDNGFHLSDISGCNGELNGNEYHVAPINSSCMISATFAKNSHTVTTEVSTGGKISSPTTDIAHGDSVNLMLTAHTDHTIGEVSGCEGQLVNFSYITGNIYQDCTVSVAFDSILPLPEAPLTRVRIPVVVHIMDNEYVQLPDEKIISQIAATNRHFRQQNLDELATITDEHQQYIADIGIQFYLADEDPHGNPHNGIIRVNSTVSVFDSEFNFAKPELGGSEPWPNDRYINIWVGYSKDRFGLLGIAGRAHIPSLSPDQYIGVSIAQSLFGTLGANEPGYEQGKTLTHELGHFLGLIGHVNGNYEGNSNHATLPCSLDTTTDCQNLELTDNFMQVETNDHGVKMFSFSQKDLMRDWLETGPLQALYLNSLP